MRQINAVGWAAARLAIGACRGGEWMGASVAAAERPWKRSYPAGLDWETALPARTVYDLLAEAVASWPDESCLDFLGRV
jgi:hypothetical protein